MGIVPRRDAAVLHFFLSARLVFICYAVSLKGLNFLTLLPHILLPPVVLSERSEAQET